VGCSSVCWNPSIIDPQTLVVGCLYDQKKDNKNDLIQIFAYSDQKKEYTIVTSLKDNGHTDSVTDCQWAPVFGRSYHLIASCSLDKTIRIWRVDLSYSNTANSEGFDNIQISYSLIYTYNHDKQVIDINISFGEFLGIWLVRFLLL
jgi:WD40 repeat protein